jgi:hypothetical protein
MQCPSCGASLPEGAQSCPTCGRMLVSVPTPVAAEQPASSEQTTPPQPEIAPAQPIYAPPSQPYYGYPSQPLYGPPPQPYYGAPPSMPLVGAQPSTSSGAARILLGGIPLWVGIVALLSVGAIILGGLLLRLEWARIAVVAGFDAAIGAGLILTAAIVILLVRRAQWPTLGLSALLVLILGLGTVAALTNQPAIHRLQAQNLENSKQWSAAITQYSRSGEEPPHAPNIARVHLEWGEQVLTRGIYATAVDLFHQAQEDDSSAATTERANRDLFRAFTAWLQSGPTDNALRGISSFLDGYIQTPQCDSACRQTTRPLAAQALYLYAVLLRKQLTSYCDPAVATAYKDVASRYADTPSGQKAAADLAAPVKFVALVQNLPNPQGLHAWLSKAVAPDSHDYITSFSEEYATDLDATGTATFPAVAPGKYNFSLLLPSGFHTYWRYTSPRFDPYTAVSQPLCGASEVFVYTP